MYKRPSSKNAFQYKEPKTKMRKLDVSVCGASKQTDTAKPQGPLQLSRPSTSKCITNDKRNVPSSPAHTNKQPDVAPHPQVIDVPPTNDENLWRDNKRNIPSSSAGTNKQPNVAPQQKIINVPKANDANLRGDDKRNVSSSSAQTYKQPDVVIQPQIISVPSGNDEHLWDDADDECILMASQMLDNMETIGQQIIVQSMNMSQGNAVETKMNKQPNVYKDLLQSTEEEDRIFSELNNFDNIGNINQHMNEILKDHHSQANQRPPQVCSQRPTSPSVFKIPTQFRVDKRTNASLAVPSSTQNDLNFSFRPEGQPQSTQFSQRIEIPQPLEQRGSLSLRQNLNIFTCHFL